jgi:hypothetical protein
MHGICASNNPSRTRPRPPSLIERLRKVVDAGSCDGSGLASRDVFWTEQGSRKGCDSRTRRVPRSANGQIPIPILGAAHELRRISADNNSDNNLLPQTQTTNCEDRRNA